MKVGVTCAIVYFFFKTIAPINSFVTTNYSTWDEHQLIAQDAKKVGCTDISVLVSQTSRTAYKTLESMDLVIHTTTWWGEHPSMAYYADAPTHYFYSVSEFEKQMVPGKVTSCFIMETADWNDNWNLRLLSKNTKYLLAVVQ